VIKFFAGAAAVALMAGAAQAATFVTVEAAGVQNTTVAFLTAVETFDALTPGIQVPTSTAFASFGAPATFTSTSILVADEYGGAGGIGNQVAVRETGDLDINFTGTPLNFFGVWASALDANNTVSFYQGNTLLSSINLTAFSLGGSYNGNPTAPFLGQNSSEKYAFFNFRITEGYDRVVLSQNGGGGFELDNVTIGVVPEPATWGLMIVGFGLVGFAARRRKIVAA